jgi:hypothetical protein
MALLSGFAGVYTEVILIKSLHLPLEVSLMAVCFNPLPNFYRVLLTSFHSLNILKLDGTFCLKFV